MTTHFVANFIKRNIDKISPFELDRNESRGDILFTVSGGTGSGKTAYLNRSLEQIAGNAPTIVIDRLNPLLGYGDLLSIIARECEGRMKLSKLQFLIDTSQQINGFGLFEFVSRRSVHPNLNLDIISDAFIKDFSIYQNIWIVLDHYSSNDILILDWLRLLLNKKRNFSFRIVHTGNFKNINHQEFDLPNRCINIPFFSDEQCEEFYTKSANKFNALGLLNAQSAKYIANNSPLWLQWLAHCPRDWMKLEKDAKFLDDTVLSSIATDNQKDFLAQVATSYFLNKKILDEIKIENGIVDGEWLFSRTLREYPDSTNIAIHHSIKSRLRDDMMLGNAPKSEKDYHHTLYKTIASLSQDWLLNVGEWPSNELTENIKGLIYHRSKCDVASIVDELYARILLKFVLKYLGLLDEILLGNIETSTANLKNFYFHLHNRKYSDARAVWEFFYLGNNFQNNQIKSSFLAILGFLLFLEDRNDEAYNIFSNAISLNQSCSLAYLGRGLFFQDKRQKQDAINDLSQAIKLDPQLSVAYNERGVLHLSLGKPNQALEDFEMALRTQPNYIQAMINLGVLLYQMQDYPRAKKWISKAIQIDSVEAKSYISLMKLQIDTKILLN